MTAAVFKGLTGTIQRAYKEPAKATYTPSVGPAVETDVIFLALHREVDVNQIPYGDARPVAWVREADVPDPKFGEGMEINGDAYKIREVEHDGLESFKLVLSKE
jgi:hypothetical protein